MAEQMEMLFGFWTQHSDGLNEVAAMRPYVRLLVCFLNNSMLQGICCYLDYLGVILRF